MNSKKTITMLVIALTAVTLIGGCKKKESPPPPPQTESMGMQQGEPNEADKALLASIEQKTCPLTDQPIDPKVSIEYQGKKVYFCCSACIGPFKKNPEKYISKLPQFTKK